MRVPQLTLGGLPFLGFQIFGSFEPHISDAIGPLADFRVLRDCRMLACASNTYISIPHWYYWAATALYIQMALTLGALMKPHEAFALHVF